MSNAAAVRPVGGRGARREAGSGGVQSVDRAITVLEVLARRGEAGVSEVATEIEVHKSTAFRLLAALEDRGLVEQVGDRGKYRLGFGIVRLAGAVADALDVTRQGRPVCEDLAAEIGETVNLAVLQAHYAVNLDQARGPASVATHNWVGQLTPLHCTSSGKVLLAGLAPELCARLIAEAGLPALTPDTITSGALLDEELERVRRLGYAVAVEEYEIGLNAMAAPIRGRDGAVVAAVSTSGPAYRFGTERMHETAPVLLAGAAAISRRLGFVDQVIDSETSVDP